MKFKSKIMTNPHKTHFSNIHVNIVMYILKQNPKKKHILTIWTLDMHVNWPVIYGRNKNHKLVVKKIICSTLR